MLFSEQTEKYQIVVIEKDFARMDELYDRLEPNQIQCSLEGTTIYLGVWSIKQICSHDSIQDISVICDISERAGSHSHSCGICGVEDGNVNRYSRTDYDGYGFSVHEECLQSFATHCRNVLKNNKSKLVSIRI